jgi:hypothetical protein
MQLVNGYEVGNKVKPKLENDTLFDKTGEVVKLGCFGVWINPENKIEYFHRNWLIKIN